MSDSEAAKQVADLLAHAPEYGQISVTFIMHHGKITRVIKQVSESVQITE